MMNLSSIIETHAKFRSDREAIVYGGMRLTFKQLNDMACQVANALMARGIKPGDKVALSCPNLPYFPVVYYYQGRVREGLKSAVFAESYRTYLSLRGQAGEDPLLPEIRKRLGQ